ASRCAPRSPWSPRSLQPPGCVGLRASDPRFPSSPCGGSSLCSSSRLYLGHLTPNSTLTQSVVSRTLPTAAHVHTFEQPQCTPYRLGKQKNRAGFLALSCRARPGPGRCRVPVVHV